MVLAFEVLTPNHINPTHYTDTSRTLVAQRNQSSLSHGFSHGPDLRQPIIVVSNSEYSCTGCLDAVITGSPSVKLAFSRGGTTPSRDFEGDYS